MEDKMLFQKMLFQKIMLFQKWKNDKTFHIIGQIDNYGWVLDFSCTLYYVVSFNRMMHSEFYLEFTMLK